MIRDGMETNETGMAAPHGGCSHGGCPNGGIEAKATGMESTHCGEHNGCPSDAAIVAASMAGMSAE